MPLFCCSTWRKPTPAMQRIEAIQTYTQSGADLTRQLLGFARGGKYETKPTDLNTVADTTAGMFWRTHKEIQLHRNLEQDLWIVEADRGQMEQVLLNLFVNAWHAMPDGGRSVHCHPKPGPRYETAGKL